MHRLHLGHHVIADRPQVRVEGVARALGVARQDVAVAANTAEFTCIEINPNDWIGGGAGRPFGLFVPCDHILNKES